MHKPNSQTTSTHDDSSFSQALDLASDSTIEENLQTQLEIKNEELKCIKEDDLSQVSHRFQNL